MTEDAYRWQVAVDPKDYEEDAMESWLDSQSQNCVWIANEGRVLFSTQDDAQHFASVWGGIVTSYQDNSDRGEAQSPQITEIDEED